ncbi:MAG: flavodoxin domain-containing protein, partial [Xanthomonadales bacterium]|nr:flavodoxin domain-containing protein [Xanthomonadales bacterium]
LSSLADLRLRDLRGLEAALFVVSTQGDGEPPEDCRSFFEALDAESAPQLSQLRYAVLALGDSSYPHYCAAGRRLDARLAALGAQPAHERLEADLDFARTAPPWLAQWQSTLAPVESAPQVLAVPTAATTSAPTPEQPLALELLSNLPLTTSAALREVRHLELAFEPGQLGYQPGDALGLRFANPPELVEPVLQALAIDAQQPVQLDGDTLTLQQALAERLEISRLGRPLLQQLAQHSGDARLQSLLQPANSGDLQRYLRGHQLLDLLQAWPGVLDAQRLVDSLPPLQQRLYSIASSPIRHADEVHLTVALRRDQQAERLALGACSTALAQLQPGQQIGAWVQPNERFRLPSDPSRDIIMIGPGTGVAPYRGFLAERNETGASGRHWLFFGCRRRADDFLYQTEWLQAQRDGKLQRLSTAFSRDGSARTYVQDRLRAEAAELYRWIDGGAHIYLCGDAFAMAPAVESALVDVLAAGQAGDGEAAAAQLAQLRREGRFAVDVY